MKQRDDRDSGRAASPLVPDGDAFLLDTSDLDAERAFRQAVDFIEGRVAASAARTGPRGRTD